ncbi:MAG TPA: winged helix-turn-helix domain-containing protein [Gammaproteobacteria bacterium]|nr:winged helix-turn-helix domain-containing protein [Gammaproteobacteria bacterium]
MNPMPEPAKVHYSFGQYCFKPHSGELNDGQKTVQLRPQVAKLLDLLLSNAGNTVSREDIRNHLWGSHVVVEFEEGISACVRQLRIALNDGASGTRYIQTISRRGYKFVYPVTVQDHDNPAAQPRVVAAPGVAPAPAGPAVKHRAPLYATVLLLAIIAVAAVVLVKYRAGGLFSEAGAGGRAVVAVLPFTNLSQNPDNGLLGASVAGEVINLLGPIAPARMGVIANTSTAHFTKGGDTIKDIGQQLGADYVLEGSVVQQGRAYHVSARLIRVADQNYVWGDEYELDANYTASAYKQLVIRIATQVAALLAPSAAVKPLAFTNNRDAALSFQAGRELIAQGEYQKAYVDCQKAMSLDTRFAAAQACAAYALLRQPDISKSELGTAQGLVDRSLSLDPGSAEGHMLKGELEMFYAWNLDEAGQEFKQALQYNPGDAWTWLMYGEYLAAQGRYGAMQNAVDTARSLDPASISVTNDPALAAYVAEQYDTAVADSRINASLNSQDLLAQHILTLSLLSAGKYADASKQVVNEMQALKASPADLAAVQGGKHGSLVGYFTWYAGHAANAPGGKFTAVFLADAYMHLGKADEAFAVLDGAYKQHSISTLMPFISVWPSLRPLCNRADFLTLTKDLGQVGCLPQQ